MGILSLPAELRLHIYSYFLPSNPLSSPRATYMSLLVTCKEIHHELEPEIIKRSVTFFASIQARCRATYSDADVHFSTPTCIKDLLNMKFTRPVHCGTLFTRKDPFMALFYLDFSTLTITSLGSGDSNLSSCPTYRYSTAYLVRWLDRDSMRVGPGQTGPKLIVYEWPSAPQPLTSSWGKAVNFGDSLAWRAHVRTESTDCYKRIGECGVEGLRARGHVPRISAVEFERM